MPEGNSGRMEQEFRLAQDHNFKLYGELKTYYMLTWNDSCSNPYDVKVEP